MLRTPILDGTGNVGHRRYGMGSFRRSSESVHLRGATSVYSRTFSWVRRVSRLTRAQQTQPRLSDPLLSQPRHWRGTGWPVSRPCCTSSLQRLLGNTTRRAGSGGVGGLLLLGGNSPAPKNVLDR